MPAWITLSKEIWYTEEGPGFYVGGPDNWNLVMKPSTYPANNVDGMRKGIEFRKDGKKLEAFVQDQLLVLLMVASEKGHHNLKSLFQGFMWDEEKWTGGTIDLVDGLVKISEHSRPD